MAEFNINNDGASIEKQQIAEKIVDGDEVHGDKHDNHGNIVEGDNHGTMDVVNAGGDYHEQCAKAVGDCVDVLSSEVFAPLPGDSERNEVKGEETLPSDVTAASEELDEPGDGAALDPVDLPPGEATDLIEISEELHPQTLLGVAQNWAQSETEPTEEEAKDFGDKWTEMLRIGGEKASKALELAGPVAIAMIDAAATAPPFPWNLVGAGLKAMVNR